MRVRVLGSAAGGGFPQWNCHCEVCDAARAGVRAVPRTQSSIAIRGTEGPWFLVNASPDLREQLESLDAPDGVRASPIAGVLLTDAEIDHTAGLLLMRESGTPLRIYGEAGIKRALSDGYPVLAVLERYSGTEWVTLEPGRPQPLAGSSLVRRVIRRRAATRRAISTGELEASGLVFGDGERTITYVPGLARIDYDVLARLAASDLVLVDGTFWHDDELAAPGHRLGPQRARHGPRAAGRTRRHPRDARRARPPAQGAGPHQQHEPDPARRLPERERVVRGVNSPAIASKSQRARGVRRRVARAGGRATTTSTRSMSAWTRAS